MLSNNDAVKSIVLYICDENKFHLQSERLEEIVTSSTVPLIGGIFPEIILRQQNYQTEYLLVSLEAMLTTYTIHGLSDKDSNYESLLKQTITKDNFNTMITFVDSLATPINSMVQSLYAIFGSEINYIEGGARSLSFVQDTCVFTEKGVHKDSTVIATLSEKLPTVVGHGWEAFSTKYQITLAEKNIVKEIDYKNALEIYESIIKVDQTIDADNFFTIA